MARKMSEHNRNNYGGTDLNPITFDNLRPVNRGMEDATTSAATTEKQMQSLENSEDDKESNLGLTPHSDVANSMPMSDRHIKRKERNIATSMIHSQSEETRPCSESVNSKSESDGRTKRKERITRILSKAKRTPMVHNQSEETMPSSEAEGAKSKLESDMQNKRMERRRREDPETLSMSDNTGSSSATPSSDTRPLSGSEKKMQLFDKTVPSDASVDLGDEERRQYESQESDDATAENNFESEAGIFRESGEDNADEETIEFVPENDDRGNLKKSSMISKSGKTTEKMEGNLSENSSSPLLSRSTEAKSEINLHRGKRRYEPRRSRSVDDQLGLKPRCGGADGKTRRRERFKKEKEGTSQPSYIITSTEARTLSNRHKKFQYYASSIGSEDSNDLGTETAASCYDSENKDVVDNTGNKDRQGKICEREENGDIVEDINYRNIPGAFCERGYYDNEDESMDLYSATATRRSTKNSKKSFNDSYMSKKSLESSKKSFNDSYMSKKSLDSLANKKSNTYKELIIAQLVTDTLDDEERDAIYLKGQQDAEEEAMKKILATAAIGEASTIDENKSSWKIWCTVTSFVVICAIVIGSVLGTRKPARPTYEPPNNACYNATLLKETEIVPPTFDATWTSDELIACHDNQNMNPGVWYAVEGNGYPMTLSVCESDWNDIQMLQISIYTGSCGVDLECVGAMKDLHCPGSMTWASRENELYYVLVRSDDEKRTFTLSLQQNVKNDICETATEISALSFLTPHNHSVTGTALGAMIDDISSCDVDTVYGAGVWYVVEGNGDRFVTSTCFGDTGNYSVTVYSGSCDELECVETVDNECELSWVAYDNESYYLLVRGLHIDTSDFEFDFYTTVANDICETSTSIKDGQSVSGSTFVAMMEDSGLHSCGTAEKPNQPGVWYTFEGSGRLVTLSTCLHDDGSDFVGRICPRAMSFVPLGGIIKGSSEDGGISFVDDCNGNPITGRSVWYTMVGDGSTFKISTCVDTTDFNYRLSVFRGSCEALECLVDTKGCGEDGSVEFSTILEETYYVLVHGTGDDVGEFTMSVSVDQETCSGAIGPLEIGSTTFGSSKYASADVTDFIFKCDVSHITGNWFDEFENHGVWYRFESSRNGTIYASTCHERTNYGAYLAVFVGSCEGHLECVVIDGFWDYDCTTVSWDAMEGEVYYVLVFQSKPPDVRYSGMNAGGEFGLTIVNDTNKDLIPEAFVVGEKSTIDTQISVFKGDCGDLECVDGNNYYCGERSSVTFPSEAGETYHVLVHANSWIEFPRHVTNFQLTMKEKVLAFSDDCVTAIGPLPTKALRLHSTTVNASIDDLYVCDKVVDTPGVWFSVVGTGERLGVSTCNGRTDFDSRISILTGNAIFETGCKAMQCTDAEVFPCFDSIGSRAIFDSEAGQLYYIYVYGPEATNHTKKSSGPFTLLIDPPPRNDHCEGAIGPLPLNIETRIIGSTSLATFDDVDVCGDASNGAPGVWYKIVGTGTVLIISTYTDETTFDTQISIFKGSCGNLECISGNDDKCGNIKSEVVFVAEEGVEYFILVHGFNTSIGGFGLIVHEGATNNICSTATELTIGTSMFGSTMESSSLQCDECSAYHSYGYGLWYYLESNRNETIIVSTCSNNTDFDTRLLMYTGSCIDSDRDNSTTSTTSTTTNDNDLECSFVNDDSCGFQSSIIFDAIEGTRYYILVQGWNEYHIGNFELSVEIYNGTWQQYCSEIVQDTIEDDGWTCSGCDGTGGELVHEYGIQEEYTCNEYDGTLCGGCNDDNTTCGHFFHGEGLGRRNDNYQYNILFEGFQYTTGRNDRIYAWTFNNDCHVVINGMECNSCNVSTIMGEVEIDCNNVEHESFGYINSYDSITYGSGVLEYLSPNFGSCIFQNVYLLPVL